MKTKLLCFCVCALAASSIGYSAAPASSQTASSVTVSFDHPENFKDVKASYAGDSATSPYLGDFRNYLEARAPKYLQPGEKLFVTFTDIDLAGEYEPWRGPRTQDTRIIKSIYAPHLKFDYRITDSSGAVVKEGHANLTDLNFQMDTPIGLSGDDPLRYEKQLLNDWMSDRLEKEAKAK